MDFTLTQKDYAMLALFLCAFVYLRDPEKYDNMFSSLTQRDYFMIAFVLSLLVALYLEVNKRSACENGLVGIIRAATPTPHALRFL